MELTEDELIAAIRKVASGDAPGVVVGIGDDAAVVELGRGQQVLTTDMLVEDVHFDRASISPRDLGAKAITVNVSDVAAMGGSPRFALVSLGLDPGTEAAWVIELYGGMRAACDEYALSIAGGDVNRAAAIVLSVTVVGEVMPGRAVTRGGAHPGDLVVVTGALGAAAGGLALSRLEPTAMRSAVSAPWGRALLDAFERPVARVGEGQALAQSGVTAMMDLSDGLGKDLSRLCSASGAGARIEPGHVPIAPALREGAETLGVDPLRLAISGGEDYELVATIDATAFDLARERLHDRFGVPLTDVGVIVEGDEVVLVGEDGASRPIGEQGWDHFAHA